MPEGFEKRMEILRLAIIAPTLEQVRVIDDFYRGHVAFEEVPIELRALAVAILLHLRAPKHSNGSLVRGLEVSMRAVCPEAPHSVRVELRNSDLAPKEGATGVGCRTWIVLPEWVLKMIAE